jgi:hypothetical protein
MENGWKWEMENRIIVKLPRSIVDSVAGKGATQVQWASGKGQSFLTGRVLASLAS